MEHNLEDEEELMCPVYLMAAPNTATHCKHEYCDSCLTRCIINNFKQGCPICRQPFFPEDIVIIEEDEVQIFEDDAEEVQIIPQDEMEWDVYAILDFHIIAGMSFYELLWETG